MKNKIKREAMEWFHNTEDQNTQSIESLVDLVMDKTTDALFEEIKKELVTEFQNGNLKHDFIISPDYYLELKLKAVKQNFTKILAPDQPEGQS